MEFLEHAPKKQEPLVDSKHSYDQGYWFNKKGYTLPLGSLTQGSRYFYDGILELL